MGRKETPMKDTTNRRTVRIPGEGIDEESTTERNERLQRRAEERDREKKRVERFGR
jgi:hypothetical protein